MTESVWDIYRIILMVNKDVLSVKPVPLTLCLPQIPREMGLHSARLATNYLSHRKSCVSLSYITYC